MILGDEERLLNYTGLSWNIEVQDLERLQPSVFFFSKENWLLKDTQLYSHV